MLCENASMAGVNVTAGAVRREVVRSEAVDDDDEVCADGTRGPRRPRAAADGGKRAIVGHVSGHSHRVVESRIGQGRTDHVERDRAMNRTSRSARRPGRRQAQDLRRRHRWRRRTLLPLRRRPRRRRAIAIPHTRARRRAGACAAKAADAISGHHSSFWASHYNRRPRATAHDRHRAARTATATADAHLEFPGRAGAQRPRPACAA